MHECVRRQGLNSGYTLRLSGEVINSTG